MDAKREFYVSYHFKTGLASGTGSIQITIKGNPKLTWERMKAIENTIKQSEPKSDTVIILNMIELEE